MVWSGMGSGLGWCLFSLSSFCMSLPRFIDYYYERGGHCMLTGSYLFSCLVML